MKTFYTERDIVDMHAAGVTAIEIDDDVVLTDLAREKAITLGIHMNRVEKRTGQPQTPGLPRMAVAPQIQLPPAVIGPDTPPPPAAAPPSPPSPAPTGPAADPEVERIKSAVIARLGTSAYNDLLDKIIPQVLARLSGR